MNLFDRKYYRVEKVEIEILKWLGPSVNDKKINKLKNVKNFFLTKIFNIFVIYTKSYIDTQNFTKIG